MRETIENYEEAMEEEQGQINGSVRQSRSIYYDIF